jgi:hypothetical protein
LTTGDNAVAEATFSTIKVEYVNRRQFRTRDEAQLKIATWITDLSGYAGDPWLSPALRLRRASSYRLRTINGSSPGGSSRITESSTIPGD